MENKRRSRLKLVKPKRVRIQDCEIDVRDLRDKFYMIDDAYLNGYARACGIYATGVYNVLCRHVGGDQSCFPSIVLMSDKLGISIRQVTRAIKALEFCGIVKVERVPGGRSKYWLTDKTNWKDKSVTYYKIDNIRRATRAEKKRMTVNDELKKLQGDITGGK